MLLAAEQGAVRKEWGGRIAVALVYPNTYAVGMSNLGFQTIYRHLNALPDVVCERVFLPDPADVAELERTRTPPFSLESQRPLGDFHMVGFSVTYEGDYINVLRLLALAGLPLRAGERRAHDPLILMGGVCAFSNPEPLAPFMDLVVVGEGEELVGELLEAYRRGYRDRASFLDLVMALPGVYVPERYDVRYAADGTLAGSTLTMDQALRNLVFTLGLGVTGYISHDLLHKNAREEVVRNAGVMLEAALSMRGYTVGQVSPLLPYDSEKFHPQSVPAYAATEIMNTPWSASNVASRSFLDLLRAITPPFAPGPGARRAGCRS